MFRPKKDQLVSKNQKSYGTPASPEVEQASKKQGAEQALKNQKAEQALKNQETATKKMLADLNAKLKTTRDQLAWAREIKQALDATLGGSTFEVMEKAAKKSDWFQEYFTDKSSGKTLFQEYEEALESFDWLANQAKGKIIDVKFRRKINEVGAKLEQQEKALHQGIKTITAEKRQKEEEQAEQVKPITPPKYY